LVAFANYFPPAMNSPESISVQRIAELARLEISPGDAIRVQSDLDSILQFVSVIDQLELDGVEPFFGVPPIARGQSSVPNPVVSPEQPSIERPAISPDRSPIAIAPALADVAEGPMRIDVAAASYDRDQMLANAPATDSRFYQVPPVFRSNSA
jgi:Asp-tRNA(Asn)/Glu-tRNA(Gln) amidotransferase C subunit